MVSGLEKLLLGLMAAVAIRCGSEPTSEECREGREWNGSECVAVDTGYDTGSDAAAEELEPECYTHAECGDDELCIEGSCESIESACRIDESAPCDENSRFNGVYELITDNCGWRHIVSGFELLITHLDFFDENNNCQYPSFATLSLNDRVCHDYEGSQEGNLLTIYNSDIFSAPAVTEITKCAPTIIQINYDNSCEELFEFRYVNTEGSSCIE